MFIPVPANWVVVPPPGLGLGFTDLGGWFGVGHVHNRLLSCTNGKIYKVTYKSKDSENPAAWRWEVSS